MFNHTTRTPTVYKHQTNYREVGNTIRSTTPTRDSCTFVLLAYRAVSGSMPVKRKYLLYKLHVWSGTQKRKQALKHVDFMQKVPKLTAFFGGWYANATTV